MLTHTLHKDSLKQLLTEMFQSTTNQSALTSLDRERAVEWATQARLIDGNSLTQEGRIVIKKDPYLETAVTEWLIHFNLSQSDRLWTYFVYEFLPKHSEFSKSELVQACSQHLALKPATLDEKVSTILSAYSETGALAGTNLLRYDDEKYIARNPSLSNPYTVGYILAKVWEAEFGSQSTVFVTELLAIKLELHNALGITIEQFRQQLDSLTQSEIIKQQSAKPRPVNKRPQQREENELNYQVCRCWDTTIELLEKAYENDIATPNRPLIQSLSEIFDDDDNDIPDFSQFLEWAIQLTMLNGGLVENLGVAS